MNKKSRLIAYLAILFALITVLTFVGLQPIFGIINIAILSLIAIIVAVQIFGLKIGVLATTYFGILSFVKAYTNPTGVLFSYLQNPLVSIFPRIIIGITVYFSYQYFKKLFSGSQNKTINFLLPSALSAAIGVLTNTGLLLGLLSLLYGNDTVVSSGTVMQLNSFIIGIITTNTLIEFVGCILFVPPIVYALKRARVWEIKE